VPFVKQKKHIVLQFFYDFDKRYSKKVKRGDKNLKYVSKTDSGENSVLNNRLSENCGKMQ